MHFHCIQETNLTSFQMAIHVLTVKFSFSLFPHRPLLHTTTVFPSSIAPRLLISSLFMHYTPRIKLRKALSLQRS